MTGEKSGFEQLVESAFLSAAPRIGRLPHTLVRCGMTTLRAVSASTGSALGLWGERPMFRADGKHYLEPPDSRILGDFELWKLDPNQQYLLERACVGPDPSFKMFISADTPVSVLFRTYEHFDSDEGSPWFGDYIEYVCHWLPDLKWALIPLEGELDWCIFATAANSRATLQKVRAEFHRNQIPTAHLNPDQDRFVWTDD